MWGWQPWRSLGRHIVRRCQILTRPIYISRHSHWICVRVGMYRLITRVSTTRCGSKAVLSTIPLPVSFHQCWVSVGVKSHAQMLQCRHGQTTGGSSKFRIMIGPVGALRTRCARMGKCWWCLYRFRTCQIVHILQVLHRRRRVRRTIFRTDPLRRRSKIVREPDWCGAPRRDCTGVSIVAKVWCKTVQGIWPNCGV